MKQKVVGLCVAAGIAGGTAVLLKKQGYNLLGVPDANATGSKVIITNAPAVSEPKEIKAEQLLHYKNLVKTFKPSDFQPDDWFTSNCHFQTIVGSGALTGKLFGDPVRPFTTTKRRIETPDNDFFDIEYCNDINDSDDVVLILHGLEGTAKSAYVTNTAKALIDRGFSCILVSFRGCSGELNRTPGAYHVGFTTDLRQLVDLLVQELPGKRFYFTGTSLGGNVILKYLGELGHEAELKKNIAGAAVACVPFDPKRCQSKIDVGWNRVLYSENFLATLKRKAEFQYKRFPGSFDIDGVRAARTVGDFDEAYIARLYNFKDKFDYYERSGSIRFLQNIRVPTIAFNAVDDPFIEAGSLPTEEAHVGDEAPVRLIYHNHGGHCGFYTRRMRLPKSPVAITTEEGDKAAATTTVEEYEDVPVPPHGWLAEEAARCLDHIRRNRSVSRDTQ